MVDRKNLRIMINIVLKYKELTYLKDKLLLSENDISTLLSFMFELTPTGFEHYIGEYLKTIQKFDNIIFTGGYKDKGIDIKGKKDGYLYAIQCKKYGASHVEQKEILDFVQNTEELRKTWGNKIRLYFITTNRVNKYAKKIAKKYGIIVRNYKNILEMEKQFSLIEFIKRHKGDGEILEGIDFEDVLNVYHIRKRIKRMWLADVIYFILKYTLLRFSDRCIDYEKIEQDTKHDKTQYYELLLEKSPIPARSTFIGEIK